MEGFIFQKLINQNVNPAFCVVRRQGTGKSVAQSIVDVFFFANATIMAFHAFFGD